MRILNKEQLTNHGNTEGRKIVAELLDAGLDSINPYFRVKEFLSIEGDFLHIHNAGFEMKGDPHSGGVKLSLKDYDNIYVIGAAKGVQQAGKAFEEALKKYLDILMIFHIIFYIFFRSFLCKQNNQNLVLPFVQINLIQLLKLLYHILDVSYLQIIIFQILS